MPHPVDLMTLQAIRQADAAWAAVRESQLAVRWAVLGVIVNFLLALVAVGVPAWQRRVIKRDMTALAEKARRRFIDSFEALADAQAEVALACSQDSATAAASFAAAETALIAASAALTNATATAAIPVSAMVGATLAQEHAKKTAARFPDLILYGTNLMTWEALSKELQDHASATRILLAKAKAADGW